MVGMEDEEQVECIAHDRVDFIVLAGVTKHHPQEIPDVVEAVERVEKGLADRVLVSVGREGRKLGDQAVC